MCLCVAEEDETAHQIDLAGAWTCGYSLQPKPWFDLTLSYHLAFLERDSLSLSTYTQKSYCPRAKWNNKGGLSYLVGDLKFLQDSPLNAKSFNAQMHLSLIAQL